MDIHENARTTPHSRAEMVDGHRAFASCGPQACGQFAKVGRPLLTIVHDLDHGVVQLSALSNRSIWRGSTKRLRRGGLVRPDRK